MNLLFKVREFVWVIVSEIEDWVYPYRTRLTEEEKYEHGMKDPMTGEITMIENLLQADNERIQRLQDEMINAQTRLYDIEQTLKRCKSHDSSFYWYTHQCLQRNLRMGCVEWQMSSHYGGSQRRRGFID